MDDRLLELRNATYAAFVEHAGAPTSGELAAAMGLTEADVEAGWRDLHDAHAIVLHRHAAEIQMANPFAAAPTAHRVRARDRWWYANCAWDAFGVCAALRCDGEIHTPCADCGVELVIPVRDEQPANGEDLLFHCIVPAARWWDDIGFT